MRDVSYVGYSGVCDLLSGVLDEKNRMYGDAHVKVAKILMILFPDGISVEQYSTISILIRALDKIARIAADRDALLESAWMDLAGYAVLGWIRDENMRSQK